MNEKAYYRDILAINSANFAANIENVSINEQILQNGKSTDRQIIYLLEQILKEVIKNDSERSI